MEECKFGNNIETIKPDGVHELDACELDACDFVCTQVLKNGTMRFLNAKNSERYLMNCIVSLILMDIEEVGE